MSDGYSATGSGPTERIASDGAIEVVGARTHNLRQVSVRIPKGRVVAFTGVSGSGKTSLAVDTVHAEAQLRYLEGISPFVRQFVTPKDRPRVDRIDGLTATLAVDQRRLNRNARSTVATITTLGDHLGLLYSRLPPLGPGWQGPVLSADHFDRYSPEGACPACHGAGGTARADPDRIVPHPERPLLTGASPWFERPHTPERAALVALAAQRGIDLDVPWRDLPAWYREATLFGTGDEIVDVETTATLKKSGTAVDIRQRRPLAGAIAQVERLSAAAEGDAARERYGPFLRWAECGECGGTGYGPVARAVRLGGLRYDEVLGLEIAGFRRWLADVTAGLSGAQHEVTGAVLPELTGRLTLLNRLGLGHIQLNRDAPSLSGGELQRVRVAAQLGTALTGIAYVLDEPSSGLHPADKRYLHVLLAELRDRGNTVLLVEHDPALVRHADWVFDLGPGAGRDGGAVVAQGPPAALAADPASPTGRYLAAEGVYVRRTPRPVRPAAAVFPNVAEHNVRLAALRVPLGVLVGITGVSGSGKSTALHDVVARRLAGGGPVTYEGGGPVGWVAVVDQDPIGRTPRSTPATYTKAFDAIRKLFAATPQARERGVTASAFSFNSPGGRCESCTGYGRRHVDLRFLPDMWVTCETCEGRRFTPQVLEITCGGLAIDEVLDLTVREAAEVFTEPPVLAGTLAALDRVGLGYLRLGQSATELSGGEAQRMKLATAILRGARESGGVVILDEPTTGLHPSDVQRIVDALDVLLDAGNTVVVAEHDPHVVACVDWLIDMGPGAGRHGGQVINEGTPATVARGTGPTAELLRDLLPAVL